MLNFLLDDFPNNFGRIVENLNSTNDRESSEKSHGASNCWQHVHKLCRCILLDSVKCWGVEINPHKLQIVFPFIFLKNKLYYVECKNCFGHYLTASIRGISSYLFETVIILENGKQRFQVIFQIGSSKTGNNKTRTRFDTATCVNIYVIKAIKFFQRRANWYLKWEDTLILLFQTCILFALW